DDDSGELSESAASGYSSQADEPHARKVTMPVAAASTTTTTGRVLPAAAAAATATTDTAEWQRTIERVVRNVVSIRFCQTCSFDTDEAVTSEATGFVVDAARGFILTNRHVVSAGPFVGYCVFDNH